MFAFMNNKAKAEIKVIEFTHTVNLRDYHATFTDEITQYIDNADNYVIISAGEFINRDGYSDQSTAPLVEKWFYGYDYAESNTDGVIINVDNFPSGKWGLYIYNDGSKRYIKYHLFNASGRQRTVKFRVVLMRVGDVNAS